MSEARGAVAAFKADPGEVKQHQGFPSEHGGMSEACLGTRAPSGQGNNKVLGVLGQVHAVPQLI